jgi:prepilin-type N-terminal cleavage/methylation domain-containing protein
MKRLLRVVCGEEGFSMIELLTVLVILGTILAGLTTAFVQGSNAELEANRRVQAQIQANAAFDRLRRDVHCASSASISGTTITFSGCAAGTVSWCSVGSGTRYALYRKSGSSCDSAGRQYADYLRTAATFTYTAPVAATSLAKVHADFQVSVNPSKSVDTFELADDIVMRNSVRA